MSTLSDEITNDPLSRGYSGMTDAQVADSLNAVDRPAPVPVEDVRRYLHLVDAWGDIADASRDTTLLASKRKAARKMVDALQDFESFDLQNYGTQIGARLGELVTEGMLTTDQRTVIIAMEASRQSRAQELGIGRVRIGHVEEARA